MSFQRQLSASLAALLIPTKSEWAVRTSSLPCGRPGPTYRRWRTSNHVLTLPHTHACAEKQKRCSQRKDNCRGEHDYTILCISAWEWHFILDSKFSHHLNSIAVQVVRLFLLSVIIFTHTFIKLAMCWLLSWLQDISNYLEFTLSFIEFF